MEQTISELRQEVSELKAELASQKPVHEIVRYLLYFWLTISIILGIFGWRQLSDVDHQIKQTIASQFPEDTQNYRNYKKLIDDTNELYGNFKQLTVEYEAKVENLKYAKILSANFDIEGQVIDLIFESEVPGNIRDKNWRVKAITILENFKSETKQKSFDADLIFNAAQVCRQLEQTALAQEMTNAAYDLDPSPPIRALKLAFDSSNGVGEERISSYIELSKMVENLDYQASPHIVLGEAWNAAEDLREYQIMIDSIETLIDSEKVEYVPSYAYVVYARLILRQGRDNSKERADKILEAAREKYETESSLSQWSKISLKNIMLLCPSTMMPISPTKSL